MRTRSLVETLSAALAFVRMTGDELTARCTKLFGKKQWKKVLAEKSGKDLTTIRRWARGFTPVPRYVGLFLENIERERALERITSRIAKLRS